MSNPDSNVVFVDVKHYSSLAGDPDLTAASESACRAPARGFRAKSAGNFSFINAAGVTRTIPMANEELLLAQIKSIVSATTTITAGVVGW